MFGLALLSDLLPETKGAVTRDLQIWILQVLDY